MLSARLRTYGIGTLIASWRRGKPGTLAAPAFPTERDALATNRTPIKRKQYRTITPAAVEAFKRMRARRDGSRAWWRAHHELHEALRLPPWVFPFDGSEDKPLYPLDARSETTGEIWRELEAAATE